MSEIKVDTLTGKTTANDITVTVGATATMSLEQGLAKAWGHFEGSDTTLDDSFNTASLTDNSTGNYTANFSNNMSNVNYYGNMNATDTSVCSPIASGYATSSFRFGIRSSAMGFIDKDDTTYLVSGDLA